MIIAEEVESLAEAILAGVDISPSAAWDAAIIAIKHHQENDCWIADEILSGELWD